MSFIKFLILAIALVECHNRVRVDSEKGDSPIDNKISSIVTQSDPEERFPFIKFKQRKLKLDSIQHGYDSIQIRLWTSDGLYGNIDLLIIKSSNSNWEGHHYALRIDSLYACGLDRTRYQTGNEPFHVHYHKNLSPKVAWSKVIDSISYFGLMTLPDMDSVPGMKIEWLDAGEIVVEVAKKNFYRVFHYSSPEHFTGKYKEADSILGIVSVLQSTLD